MGHGSRVTLAVLLAAAAGSARAPPPLSAQCAADSAALAREKASGYDVDGEPSIFVGVASFRDPLCRSTVLDALGSAQFPSRVFFGIVQQNNAEVGDPPCLLPAERRREAGHVLAHYEGCVAESIAGSSAMDLQGVYRPGELGAALEAQLWRSNATRRRQHEAELLCRHRQQLSLREVKARDATGPTTARALHDSELFRNESFSLQIDAHMRFVAGWDVLLIAQWTGKKRESSTHPRARPFVPHTPLSHAYVRTHKQHNNTHTHSRAERKGSANDLPHRCRRLYTRTLPYANRGAGRRRVHECCGQYHSFIPRHLPPSFRTRILVLYARRRCGNATASPAC